MIEIPSRLFDAPKLSESIWKYWISIMKSDGIIGHDDESVPEWEDMDDSFKNRLEEALSTKVCKPLELFRENFLKELEAQAVNAKFAASSHACYTCGRNEVKLPGSYCSECSELF